MTTIGIIEDETHVAKTLKLTVESFGYKVGFICSNSSDAILLTKKINPDLLLIDIQLKDGGSGIDVANHIGGKTPFLFLTSQTSPEVIKEATNSAPLAYILKPFRREEIFAAIQIALNAKGNRSEPSFIFVKNGPVQIRLELEDIVYVNSDHIYIEIHKTDGRKTVIRESLNSFCEKLPSDSFIRIHQRYLVNKSHILTIGNRMVETDNGARLPISKKYLPITAQET